MAETPTDSFIGYFKRCEMLLFETTVRNKRGRRRKR